MYSTKGGGLYTWARGKPEDRNQAWRIILTNQDLSAMAWGKSKNGVAIYFLEGLFRGWLCFGGVGRYMAGWILPYPLLLVPNRHGNVGLKRPHLTLPLHCCICLLYLFVFFCCVYVLFGCCCSSLLTSNSLIIVAEMINSLI